MPGSRQQIFLLYALREGGHAPRLRSRLERASDMHLCTVRLDVNDAAFLSELKRTRETKIDSRTWAKGRAALAELEPKQVDHCQIPKWIETVQSIIITGSRQQAGRQAGRFGCLGLADACRKRAPASI